MKYKPMKVTCLSLVFMLLLFSGVPTLAENLKGAYVVRYLASNNVRVNVHGTPSIFDIENHLKEGTVVQYHSSEDGWAYVEWWQGDEDHRFGYVDPAYLSSIVSNAGSAYRTVCSVWVHSTSKIPEGHCDEYHTGDKLKKGQSVEVVQQDGTWAKVNFKGGSGWIPSIYLEQVG